ncbi:hypothetical protein, partial [Anaerobutyricum hallii]|uniref:hypothetical protein n=1 Tax=Anaerobutyricum hallii TaxID=39488 RepID=UPI00399D029C
MKTEAAGKQPKKYRKIFLKPTLERNIFLTYSLIKEQDLLFNSLSKLQTKPLPSIRHICAFSRGVLNVRSTRSHPTLAPRPQICLIEGNGFCAVAGEGELNRRGDLGTEVDVFCPLPQILATTILIQTKSSQRQP